MRRDCVVFIFINSIQYQSNSISISRRDTRTVQARDLKRCQHDLRLPQTAVQIVYIYDVSLVVLLQRPYSFRTVSIVAVEFTN